MRLSISPGHRDVKTSLVYIQVLTRGPSGGEAPPTCPEERRDLLRTVKQHVKQVAAPEMPCSSWLKPER